ncbi:MAG: glycosyl hydrolase family 57 [Acidimicrobiales bacterium]
MSELPACVDDLPNICGSEQLIEEAIRGRSDAMPSRDGAVRINEIDAAFAIALHMHQPLIPAGGADLRTAATISNLKWMIEHREVGDNHNAPVFLWCYQRMGELVPQLIDEGHRPRVMLDYSGTLFHGLYDMGASEVLEALRRITRDHAYRHAVEWLGAPWGHAVAPSTPLQDFRLHVRAWQHHFAALFGLEALGRVRGFSPSEMALPNHPDVAYEFVKTLRDCGYEWVLVQEHTVEQLDGRHPERPHLPHVLRCTSSGGETASIVAIIKTQGSDTKLVAQMQPYYEAKGLGPSELGGRIVPPLVTQIADGENGGVMMNEFPPKYSEVVRQCSGTRTPMVNVSEYLGQLWGAGVRHEDLQVVQPVLQHRIWQRVTPGDGPERLAAAIGELEREDGTFHVDGGSWTNDISWVRGYEELLIPMEKASALFHERVLSEGVPTDDRRYRNALFHLLTAETSCYRYWGEGVWTGYGAELARRTDDIITYDL